MIPRPLMPTKSKRHTLPARRSAAANSVHHTARILRGIGRARGGPDRSRPYDGPSTTPPSTRRQGDAYATSGETDQSGSIAREVRECAFARSSRDYRS